MMPMRPHFRADGTLVTLNTKTNKIHTSKIVPKESEAYQDLTDVFLKHGKIVEEICQPLLGDSFSRLSLRQ